MPPIPDTGWKTPTEFPNLASAKVISFDVETYDPELVKQGKIPSKGPGWARDSGHIVGLAIGAQGGGRWYFPVRHEVEPEYNLEPEKVFAWARHVLGTTVPKVGANLIYDYGWLLEEGVTVEGPLYDVQFAEALLNSEAPDVALELLANKYLGEGKDSNHLYEWCSDFYGGPATGRQRKNIYRAPPRLVGPYAESDADLPLRIIDHQWKEMSRLGLLDLFAMECGLIRLLVKMRYRGAPIDVPYVEQLHDRLKAEVAALDLEIKRQVGFEVNTAASQSLARAFDKLGLPYNRTASTERSPNGSPTFTADFLENVDHPVAQLIVERKQKEKLRAVFLESYLIKNNHNGKVHCQFHPLRGDENGARSGRFASSDPNLQNIPVRTEDGKRIRKAFVARGIWRKYDHSQIEYRMLAHHAVGPGSQEIRERYAANPDTDYHDTTIDLIKQLTGTVLDRRPAKTINFGLIYGMSQAELARRLHLADGGKELFGAYHRGVPFARATMKDASDFAGRYGFVSTVLGRRSLFDSWVPEAYSATAKALPLEQAMAAYGRVQRAFLHKALNRKLQGGAADVMKKGMVQCYEDGVFDYIGYPSLTVHDELDFDDETDGQKQDGWDYMKHTLETCMGNLLRVPLLVDMKIGPNWGDAD
jgi:DNA polymerase I-like protein with 3'-5' exonuclease and polymerase domains